MSEKKTIDRRVALRHIAVGGAVIAAVPVGQGAVPDTHRHAAPAPAAQTAATQVWKPRVLNAHQNETVSVLTELIIPATETPGAKAAKVNEYIDLVLSEEDESVRRDFLRGLNWMDQKSRELFGADFKDSTSEQQNALLVTLSSGRNTALEDQVGVEFFNAIKLHTVNGYYTSQIGLIKELGYKGNTYLDEFPGCTHPEHQN